MSKRRIDLRPFVSSGEPILRTDGSVDVVPMQLFRLKKRTVLRIGPSCFFFDAHGCFEGSEHVSELLTEDAAETLVDALEASINNLGKAPHEPYFPPGSPGWKAEMEGIAIAASNEKTDRQRVPHFDVRIPDPEKPN